MKSSMRLRPVLIAAAALVLLLGLTAALEACPSCKSAVASDEAGDPIKASTGYYWSILFMIGVSYAIIMGFALKIYLMYRKAMKERAAEAPAPEQAPDESEPVLAGREPGLEG